MPLEILLILVVGGIAGLAGLMHWLGFSKSFDLRDALLARQQWQRHFPEDRVAEVHLAARAALVIGDRGPGLLRVFGADTIAHRIRAVQGTPRGLRMSFGSFAAPDAEVPLDPSARRDWERALEGRLKWTD